MDHIDAKRTRRLPGLVIVGGTAVLALMLFRVPLATVFTIGLLLVCPLLMVGMHTRSHGGESAASPSEARADRKDPIERPDLP
jgi:hypothetical protein